MWVASQCNVNPMCTTDRVLVTNGSLIVHDMANEHNFQWLKRLPTFCFYTWLKCCNNHEAGFILHRANCLHRSSTCALTFLKPQAVIRSDRSITKRYPKSGAAPQVENSFYGVCKRSAWAFVVERQSCVRVETLAVQR